MLLPVLNYAFETHVDYRGDIFFAVGVNACARVELCF